MNIIELQSALSIGRNLVDFSPPSFTFSIRAFILYIKVISIFTCEHQAPLLFSTLLYFSPIFSTFLYFSLLFSTFLYFSLFFSISLYFSLFLLFFTTSPGNITRFCCSLTLSLKRGNFVCNRKQKDKLYIDSSSTTEASFTMSKDINCSSTKQYIDLKRNFVITLLFI